MAFEEKITWVSLVVGVLVPVAYFINVLGQLGGTPAADIPYQRALIVALVASVVLTIVGAIGAAIATAVGVEITGSGSVDDIDRTDERDTLIGRRGDLIGFYVASVGLLGVLVITMLELDYFWIANGLYLSLVIASVVSSIVKLVAYRRGF